MTSALGGAAGAPSLHHVALGTRGVAELARFYCRLLGVSELRQKRDPAGALRAIWLDLAGVILMLERAEPAAERAPVHGVGLGPFLLAFRADQQGRRAFEARAAELGAAVESRTDFTSYFRDPDGNRIAVSEYELDS